MKRAAIRILVTVGVIAALVLLGLHSGPVLARLADITELQAGLILGCLITWAVFRIDALLDSAEPAPAPQPHQD